ncbi:uncharacterized protein L969DRAFT_70134 [Mixia osmundae IAM 14324]|uniref:guanosine-diphosphatase n=1 Tax=Mixia osmundae (strain CBS 9802 / IAM 14324 / JCM 22182 / KY 12970) TaxID=764103 RepID=G7DT17_MIXOS|nr:uncharacterized protein L969DRAFT_70134 [Mixia osmundae IAM 14324]KEI42770.1 hypothetical protein L969DRAFT_70134 [Mixia osmundae IAM 14324]GAA93896.1 hypothetical protein E5Q_00542 [Mixia osmundae IAM 14324]
MSSAPTKRRSIISNNSDSHLASGSEDEHIAQHNGSAHASRQGAGLSSVYSSPSRSRSRASISTLTAQSGTSTPRRGTPVDSAGSLPARIPSRSNTPLPIDSGERRQSSLELDDQEAAQLIAEPGGMPAPSRVGGKSASGLASASWSRLLSRRNVAAGTVLLIFGLYAFGGSTTHELGKSAVGSLAHYKGNDAMQQDIGETANMQANPNHPTQQKETCSIPLDQRPSSYALMIDAGSTGSRIHVYTFTYCTSASTPSNKDAVPALESEVFEQLQPGLSSYSGRPREAAESLRPLLEVALKTIPESERKCTPIAVKATAGLRLLGTSESQAILTEVERWLRKSYPFHVVDDGVVIMDGRDEGVYAWITINYLLGLVGPAAKATSTAAVMDLGGASTQIVFEPHMRSDKKLSPGDHVYDLKFSSEDHVLYQHSHLGYGLMQARRSVHNLIAFTYVWQSAPKGKSLAWEDLNQSIEIPNPCLVRQGKKMVTLDPPGRPKVNVTFVGTGAGFDACRRVVDVTMAKDALCEVEPCAFGGVYQPKLMETFGQGPIYALSYFYDRIVPLGLGADSVPFTMKQLRELTADVCAGPEGSSDGKHGWARFRRSKEAMAELEDRPEYCLDLTFMYSLLGFGYELAEDRELQVGKKINDVELGWALGASISLITDTDLKCEI